jgi:hypothetical protein
MKVRAVGVVALLCFVHPIGSALAVPPAGTDTMTRFGLVG